jgi:hypothetical protein
LIFVLFVFSFFSSKLFAADDTTATEWHDPHSKGLLSSMSVGFRYNSILENRGVVLYRDFQVDPVLTAFFLDDHLEYLGNSFDYWNYIIQDHLRFRTRLVSIHDRPLFPFINSVHQDMPHRDDTYEWTNRLEWFLPGYNSHYLAEINAGIAQDISIHHGQYYDLQTKVKITDFKLWNLRLEPNLIGTIGYGSRSHNQYWYGLDAKASLADLSYGLWVAVPESADRYFPILQILHFEVLGANRQAQFAQNRSDGWLFSLILTYGI